jgi:hypothetical protein
MKRVQFAAVWAAPARMIRQLSAQAAGANLHKLARTQSTLSARIERAADEPALTRAQLLQAATSKSWAEEADKWLAHRRAAEYASDLMTAKQLSPFARPASSHSWKHEFAAWSNIAPAVGAKLASTSYAEVATVKFASKPAKVMWADETESWLAHRRAAEHASDKLLVQDIVWFK